MIVKGYFTLDYFMGNNNHDKLAVISEVAAEAAHEMRTPLTAIKNSIYFLQMAGIEGHNPKIAQHVSLINEKLDQCVRMLTNLQSFVQPTKPIKKESKIDDILTDSLTVSLANSNVKVTTEFQKDMPLVKIDPFQIRQTFDNIIRNAADSMASEGKLAITMKTEAGFVVVEFKDNGAGISPENMDKIFLPLFSTTPHNIGIGLAVCDQFVRANGGKIEVESKVGEGALFRVKLPLK